MATTLIPEMTETTTADALWIIIKSQTKAVQKIIAERFVAEDEKTRVQQDMVKESLTRAFDELHSGRVHHDARKLLSIEG